MTSSLSWLDNSREEQRRMRELLNMFSETESRDELGIGQVRDAFSDLLFPGTSTLHTRARYLLIVPWCYQLAESKGLTGDALTKRVDQYERRVIGTLKQAGHTDGLIGRVAGIAVKTLPSSIYWGALQQFGIHTGSESTLLNSAIRADHEGEELADRAIGPWTPTIPPVPDGFPGRIPGGLDLDRTEAGWLRTRLRVGAPDSLLTHLLQDGHRPDEYSATPWEDPATVDCPEPVARLMKHAELFSLGVHGASLLYNLLVAQRYEDAGFTSHESPVDAYGEALETWLADVKAERGWIAWEMADMWSVVIGKNPRIAANARLRRFVQRWLEPVADGRLQTIRDIHRVGPLVEDRERQVKKVQSRFINVRLLRTWSGASGSRRLVYRWPQARRIVDDIHVGLGWTRASA